MATIIFYQRIPYSCGRSCVSQHFRHINGLFSTLVGAHPAFILGSVLLCPVVGRSRPAVVACCTVRSGVFHHWIHHLWPQGAFPPGFNPLRRGWVYRPAPEAPRKGECRRGPRHFWNCLSRWATALRQDPP